MTDERVIDIRGLVKKFGSFRALDGLDLDVGPGEVHGFLGPNGAGKSTTIRVLLGLLRSDGGEVRLFGGDPWSQAAELPGKRTAKSAFAMLPQGSSTVFPEGSAREPAGNVRASTRTR